MADIPEGSIVITPQQVYEKVMTLTDTVTQMLAKQNNDTTQQDISDLKNRVRALEAKVWMAAGAAATLGSGIGAFFSARFSA